jgi:hypothetical protein
MPQKIDQKKKTATTASIVLAFASVYFFWGSTYTAIRIGAAEMPALLLAGTRFLIAGAILLAWCRWRGLRIFWPAPNMLRLALIGLLLLAGGNVGLVFAERTVPSGLASLVLAVTPIYVALIEMFLPRGEPLPARGWLGMALGFAGARRARLAVAAVGPGRQSRPACGSCRAACRWILLDCRQHSVSAITPAGEQLCGRGVGDAGCRRLLDCAGNGPSRMAAIPFEPRSHWVACMAYHRRFAAGVHMLYLFTGTRAGGQSRVLLPT